MLHADALVYIHGGNHTISPLALDYLEWYSKIGDMKKVIYAFNTRTSRDLAKDLQQVNIAIIKQHGWPVYVSRMIVFNAMLGCHAQQNTAQISHACSNQHCEFSHEARKRILPILAKYLNIEILDEA